MARKVQKQTVEAAGMCSNVGGLVQVAAGAGAEKARPGGWPCSIAGGLAAISGAGCGISLGVQGLKALKALRDAAHDGHNISDMTKPKFWKVVNVWGG
jgi:hypothetical protein